MNTSCSFCGTPSGQVEKILFGPEVNICSDCIRSCLNLLEGQQVPGWSITSTPQRCNACGRRPSEGYRHFVNRSLPLPHRICEHCISIFTDTLLKEVPSLEEELQDIIKQAFLKQEVREDLEREAELRASMQIAMEPAEAPTEQPKPVLSDLKKPLGLLFDLGDTLLTYNGFDPKAGTAAILEIAENPKGCSVQEINQRIERINKDLIPRREAAQIEFHPHIVQRHIYEPLGFKFDRSEEEVELLFWQAAMSWDLEPDVKEILETLTQLKLPMGIVSNAAFCGKTLLWELANHGLEAHFQFLMSSADYWVRKPHPLILDTAALKLGFEAHDLWYIGNSPQYDMGAAHNAGMGAIWYNRQQAPCDGPEPHIEIQGWKEFVDLVQKFY